MIGDGRPEPGGAEPAQYATVPAEPRLHPVLFAFLMLGGVFFTYQILGSVITVLVAGATVTDANVQLMRGLTLAGQFLLLALPAVLALAVQPWPVGASLRLHPVRPAVLAPVVLGTAALQFAFQGYEAAQDYALRQWLLTPGLESLMDKIDTLVQGMYAQLLMMRSGGEFLYVWLVIAVTPSICEEIVFRGVALTALERGMRARRAVVVTGLVFAAYHLNPTSFIPLALLGMLFAVAVQRSNSLWTGVIAHLATNSFAVFSLYFAGGSQRALTEAPISSSPTDLALISAGGLAVFAAAARWFWVLTRTPGAAPPSEAMRLPAENMSHLTD